MTLTTEEARQRHRKLPPQDAKDSLNSLESKEGERPIPVSPDNGTPIQQLKDEHREALEGRTRRKYTKRVKAGDSSLPVVDTDKRDKFVQGLALFGSMVLDIACARMPSPKPATELERTIWNNGVSQIGEKYFPAISNWDAELAFGLAVVIVFAPRLKKEEESSGATVSRHGIGENGDRENGLHKVADSK